MQLTPQMAPIGGLFLPVYHSVIDSIARILCGLIGVNVIQKILELGTNIYS